MVRPSILSGAAVVLFALSPAARAQGGGKAMAEALFQDGRNLLDAGKIHEACEKFAMSQRIEPKLGTLLNLASCHETEGRTASAWAEFMEAWTQANRANQPEREEFARDHADALQPRLSHVTVMTADRQITVRIDGVAVDGDVLGTAFPVDPGVHVIVASAPGKREWKSGFTVLAGGASITVQVPALDLEPEPSGRAGVMQPTGRPAVSPDGAIASKPRDPSAPKAAWVAFGAGAIAFAAGTFFGLRAFSLKSDAEKHCHGKDGKECDPLGLTRFDDAETSATASTIAFGTSLVAVGLGIYFLMRSAPSPTSAVRRTSPVWTGGPGGGMFRVAF